MRTIFDCDKGQIYLMKQYSGDDRRNQTNKMITELMQERQQVWSLYCTAAGLEPFSNCESIEGKVKEFCQILVDYISLGHFGIYQRIADGQERRSRVVKIAGEVYPKIAKITDAAVAFNDKYDKLRGEELINNLSGDLSVLGEVLATRIELEDQLIAGIVH